MLALVAFGVLGAGPSGLPLTGPGPSGKAPRSSGTGAVSAHDGRFWLGGRPIALRGVLLPVEGTDGRFAEIASWGMNLVRLPVNWARLEPTAPVRQPDGTWVHRYDPSYLAEVAERVEAAHRNGLWAVVGNYQDVRAYFGFPDWVYRAGYNAHGVTYPRTPEGAARAEADFWSDPLRRRFMTDALAYLARRLAGTAGVLGYEMLNEPGLGTLPETVRTTQAVLDWQLAAGRAVRVADPSRLIFFMSPSFNDLGLARADLSGLTALGNVAFDFHDYFGARWGSGWLEDPSDPRYEEADQDVFAVVAVGPSAVAPYVGSVLSQERQLPAVQRVLAPTGMPLMVGEFGEKPGDPGIERFFGTTAAALDDLGVSWACNWLAVVIDNDTGNPEPWARVVVAAARDRPGPA